MEALKNKLGRKVTDVLKSVVVEDLSTIVSMELWDSMPAKAAASSKCYSCTSDECTCTGNHEHLDSDYGALRPALQPKNRVELHRSLIDTETFKASGKSDGLIQMEASFQPRGESLENTALDGVSSANKAAIKMFMDTGGTVEWKYLVESTLPQPIAFDDLIFFDKFTIRTDGGETIELHHGLVTLTNDLIFVAYQHRIILHDMTVGFFGTLQTAGCCVSLCNAVCGALGCNVGKSLGMMGSCLSGVCSCCKTESSAGFGSVQVESNVSENLRVFNLNRHSVVSVDYTSKIKVKSTGEVAGVSQSQDPTCMDGIKSCIAGSCLKAVCFCQACKQRTLQSGIWESTPITSTRVYEKVLTLGLAQTVLPGANKATDSMCTIKLAPFVHTSLATQLVCALQETILANTKQKMAAIQGQNASLQLAISRQPMPTL